MGRLRIMAGCVAVFAVAALSGPSNVRTTDKFSWGENIGFMNWRDAEESAAGVRIQPTILSGYVWAENIGYIHLGDGQPADGLHYANADSTDFGVNIDPLTGALYGYAWGENVGWINCDTRDALGGNNQQARFDFGAGRFRGYCWGENVGWINLNHSTHFVGIVPQECSDPFADVDDDGDVDLSDFAHFQLCHTGDRGGVAPGCECFNRGEAGFPQGDNDIDVDDLAAFTNCQSGPAVPLNPACDD